ncbi:nephrocystin-3 [Selaginella moellendorffii]|uniref:nephrocystin-3 n=1 Tax=Selaginella moellendorffii TaxID=88036 RepID=UPI000D1D0B49|nr:nephrocystin-3 [Selaginella moellendorffii]XP_024538339.1 nephrocystin-3 [Selaginella moellendorffii]|eukprot:XP_024538338.1 nephrocystin-3 [Selaginella moellendorffii]
MNAIAHPAKRYALWASVPLSVGGLWALSYYLREREPVPDIVPGGTFEPQPGQKLPPNMPKLITNEDTGKWSIYTSRGKNLFTQGRLDEAEKYLVKAIDHAKKGFGEEDAHVATSFNNLAELYRLKKEYKKAEPLYLDAISLLEQSMGPEHPSVGFALHNLGGFYLLQDNFPKAIEYYERALKIKGRGLGLNHPEYANTMFHLGKAMQLTGKPTEAETLIRHSIQILEDGGYGQSQSAIRRMVVLAEILTQTNQLQEAENLQRKILHSVEITQGPEAASTIYALESLAETLQLQGNFDEAEELLKRCLDLRQKSNSGDHIQIWATLFKLACVAMGRAKRHEGDGAKDATAAEYDKAMTLLQQAIKIAENNWKQVTSASDEVKSSYFLPLVQSLSMAGLVSVKNLEASGNTADEGVKLGEKALRQCLEMFNSTDVLDVGAAREKLKCTERLEKLTRLMHGNTAEAKRLRKEASRLKAEVPAKELRA